ncbi:hypothetical protein K0B96_15270 [Horticoccus luteus]|uniref:Tetratricopeptide repeat protein n=1 Tax=Horticoccus luteus TaxID=2862869 RepID=A0A8F9TSX9_9BACT|nr:hypothetical protein [Horticoccus luteus]QYM78644.1 hypothetical protein K0B96_15270 [Horticoccus luteus]
MRIAFGMAALVLGGAVAARGAGLADGWRAIAGYQPEVARKIFAQVQAAGQPATAREARLGEAVAMLVTQPVSDAQTEAAREKFAALADEGRDDVALAARFYLGRIAQHHLSRPNPAAAAREFRALIEQQPASRWAQAAISRLALLEVYALQLDEPPAERIARAEKLLAWAQQPAARSELHLVVAGAIFHYRLPAQQALPHLLAAEREGNLELITRADTYVQIAELSRAAGNVAQARTFYEKLLREFPRDQRHYLVRQRLMELDGKQPAVASPAPTP